MICLQDLSPYSIMNINEIQVFCITKRTWNVGETWLVISITLLTLECSNDNVILKNHAEKEIQIVFTECGILPNNVNESSLNICSTYSISLVSLKEMLKEAEEFIVKFLHVTVSVHTQKQDLRGKKTTTDVSKCYFSQR
jgi:hypothetical protein